MIAREQESKKVREQESKSVALIALSQQRSFQNELDHAVTARGLILCNQKVIKFCHISFVEKYIVLMIVI